MLEIAWAVGLKFTHGLTRFWPSPWTTTAAMALSVYLLAIAAPTLPIGTAYAVWVGIGAAGALVLGTIFLGEPHSPIRVAGVIWIVAGVVGLKLFDTA